MIPRIHIPLLALLIPACSPAPSQAPINPSEVEQKMIGLQENFDAFDTDADGYLSRQELKAGMVRIGAKDTSDKRVSKVIDFYDFNKDGKISLRETQSGAVTGPEALIKKVQ